MLNYTYMQARQVFYEAGETGNGYTALFVAAAIFQDTAWSDPQNGLGAQNSVGMWTLKVTTNVQNLGALEP